MLRRLSLGFLCFLATEVLAVLALAMTCYWVDTYLCTGMSRSECYAWDKDSSPGFNNHPVYMVTSLVFLYSQAMMAYQYSPLSHTLNKMLHFTLQTVAMALMCVGVHAAFYSHNHNKPSPIPNLYSVHSWVGFTVVVLFATQYAAGLYHFMLPQDVRIPNVTQTGKKEYLKYHAYFGVALFFLAIGACWLGFFEKSVFMNAKHIFGYLTNSANGPNAGENPYNLSPAYFYSNKISMVLLFLGIVATIAISRPKEVAPLDTNTKLDIPSVTRHNTDASSASELMLGGASVDAAL